MDKQDIFIHSRVQRIVKTKQDCVKWGSVLPVTMGRHVSDDNKARLCTLLVTLPLRCPPVRGQTWSMIEQLESR